MYKNVRSLSSQHATWYCQSTAIEPLEVVILTPLWDGKGLGQVKWIFEKECINL